MDSSSLSSIAGEVTESSSSLISVEGDVEEIGTYPVGRTAKDILGLEDQRMDYIQGNVDPDIDPTNRGSSDFEANKITNPGGESFPPHWDNSR